MSIKWQLDCCTRISSKTFGKYVNGSIDREFCFKVEYLFILWANLLYRLLCQYVGDVLAYCPTVRSSDGLSVGPFQWLRCCALLMAPRDSRASLMALRLASQTGPLVLLDGNVDPREWPLRLHRCVEPLGLHRLGFSGGLFFMPLIDYSCILCEGGCRGHPRVALSHVDPVCHFSRLSAAATAAGGRRPLRP